jgi:hypothetical protein
MVALTRLIYYTWEISRIFTILSSRISSPLRHTLHRSPPEDPKTGSHLWERILTNEVKAGRAWAALLEQGSIAPCAA